MMPPPTPDFAGSPTRTIHSPASSYIPQVDITDSTRETTVGDNMRSPLTGRTPPVASTAAIIDRSRAVTVMAQAAK